MEGSNQQLAEQVRNLASLATASFGDAEIKRALEKAYFLMARFFQWPDPEARDGDWYVALCTAGDMITSKSPDLAAIYGERLDRWLVALIVQRWVPDEFLDATVRDDMAQQMKGIERLPDKPTPPSA